FNRNTPGCSKGKRHLIGRSHGLNTGSFESLDDVTTSLFAAGRVDRPALHVVGGKRLQIQQQLRRIEESAVRRILRGTNNRRDDQRHAGQQKSNLSHRTSVNLVAILLYECFALGSPR